MRAYVRAYVRACVCLFLNSCRATRVASKCVYLWMSRVAFGTTTRCGAVLLCSVVVVVVVVVALVAADDLCQLLQKQTAGSISELLDACNACITALDAEELQRLLVVCYVLGNAHAPHSFYLAPGVCVHASCTWAHEK